MDSYTAITSSGTVGFRLCSDIIWRSGDNEDRRRADGAITHDVMNGRWYREMELTAIAELIVSQCEDCS